MRRITLFGIFIIHLSYLNSSAQVKRGRLLLNEHPEVLDSFVINGLINLEYLRATCHFLTDRDITHHEGIPIARRKKAFIRHIKHLSEKLEQNYQDSVSVDKGHIEMFYELYLFRESLLQKSQANATPRLSLKDLIQIRRHTDKSKRVFRYKNAITDQEASNVNQWNIQADPSDSPFWHKRPPEVPMDKRFVYLADLKKIKAKPEMVVLFSKPSLGGSAPKITVQDLDLDNRWSLKWGDEVHTDIAGSYIFAALGYDVDHQYYFGKDKLTLIFDGLEEIKNAQELKDTIQKIYNIDLAPFISSFGVVTKEMADQLVDLKSFVGKQFVRFKKCAIEGRPDRVKRIGSIVPYELLNEERRELRGSLLAHQFIGNWDTREENTLLTNVHMGKYRYRISAVFSDLGTSFGVAPGVFRKDFKVGLVNEFPWQVATINGGWLSGKKLRLNNRINSILPFYKKATYQDLLWMAKKIMAIDGEMLRMIVNEAQWPAPIAELYYHKLASRRASILKIFGLDDPHPIEFDEHLTIKIDGKYVIKDGQLVVDFEREKNPESFISNKGRFLNYGN